MGRRAIVLIESPAIPPGCDTISRVKVELLSFPGCPSVGLTRGVLVEGLRRAGIAAVIEEIDTSSDTAPAHARGWPSPTILIDGVDLEGLVRRDDGACCRLYAGRGAPSLELVERCLRQRTGS